MSTGKFASFVVAVLVSVPVAGCASVTPGFGGGSNAPNGGAILSTSSPVSYKPSEISEPIHGTSVHTGGRIATRIQRR